MTCKRCLRPYVRPFQITINYSFRDTVMTWEGCADCAYDLQRQSVDFFLKASQPTHKAKSKLKHLARIQETLLKPCAKDERCQP